MHIAVRALLGIGIFVMLLLPSAGAQELTSDAEIPFSAEETALTLQVLHAADHEGGLDALEDAPRFSQVINALRADSDYPNTVTLFSGDLYIPGAFFNASGGQADIDIMNGLGVQAAALGNHEFDLGLNVLGGLIEDHAAFPYLSSNVDFSNTGLASLVAESGQEASGLANSIAKSVIITLDDGEVIGVVGATTPQLPSISSPGDAVVSPSNQEDMATLAGIIQDEVDALAMRGINKIILISHLQQIQNEITLAHYLADVDIIMAGGSDTLLSTESDRLRADRSGPRRGTYPLLFASPVGEPVVLINTDREYRYVGRLIAEFDADGLLTGIGDASGAYATDNQGVADTGSAEPSQAVLDAVEMVRGTISEKDGLTYGKTEVYLEGAREFVRSEETNLGNLTADANLAAAQQVDSTVSISLKNGGGIRAAIGAVEVGDVGTKIAPKGNEFGKEDGDVSQLDIENALRFNNKLALLDVSARDLHHIMEHAVARAGQFKGEFPQVAGMRFSYDPSGTPIQFAETGLEAVQPGGRVQSLAVLDAEGNVQDVIVENGEFVGGDQSYRIVTLNFMAEIRDNGRGGDNYPFPEQELYYLTEEAEGLGSTTDADAENLLGEQEALAMYLATHYSDTPYAEADTPVSEDTRIQNVSVREDTVLQ